MRCDGLFLWHTCSLQSPHFSRAHIHTSEYNICQQFGMHALHKHARTLRKSLVALGEECGRKTGAQIKTLHFSHTPEIVTSNRARTHSARECVPEPHAHMRPSRSDDDFKTVNDGDDPVHSSDAYQLAAAASHVFRRTPHARARGSVRVCADLCAWKLAHKRYKRRGRRRRRRHDTDVDTALSCINCECVCVEHDSVQHIALICELSGKMGVCVFVNINISNTTALMSASGLRDECILAGSHV